MARTPADDSHPVRPGCEPWSSPGGGPHGALVLHGFTGSTVSMRPVTDALVDAGLIVEMPRLPGHGTHVDDMIPTTFADWLAEAERGLAELRRRTDGKVVVVGLSMGGILTCALAERHDDLAGIVLINTPVSMPAEFVVTVQEMLDGGMDVMDSIGGDIADPEADEVAYDKTPLQPMISMIEAAAGVRAELDQVTCPVLIITSRQDHIVNPGDSDVIASSVAGPVERVWLDKSYHVATLDYDKAEVQATTVAFVEKVTSA
ncbi:MAG: alpha/beta fold hydrolase [Acidimicrobiales bacterium]